MSKSLKSKTDALTARLGKKRKVKSIPRGQSGTHRLKRLHTGNVVKRSWLQRVLGK